MDTQGCVIAGAGAGSRGADGGLERGARGAVMPGTAAGICR